MSAILKALKKLEQESPPPDASVNWPHPIDTRKVLTRQMRYRRLRQILVSGFVLIFLTGGVWLISTSSFLDFLQKPEQPGQSVNTEPQPVSAEKSAPAVKTVQQPVSALHSAKTQTQDSPSDRTVIHDQSAFKPVRKPVTEDVVPVRKKIPRQIFEKRVSTPLRVRAEEQVSASADDEDTEPIAIIKPVGDPAIPEREIPVFRTVPDKPQIRQPSEDLSEDDEDLTEDNTEEDTEDIFSEKPEQNSRFKLQAIVWSEDTSGRVAVINGRILRTGDSIEGVLVERIASEYVVLKEQDDLWKIGFPLK